MKTTKSNFNFNTLSIFHLEEYFYRTGFFQAKFSYSLILKAK